MPSRRAAASFFANYFLLYVSFGILVPYLQLGYIIEAHGYAVMYLCYAAVPLGGILILFTKALRAGIFDPWKPRPS